MTLSLPTAGRAAAAALAAAALAILVAAPAPARACGGFFCSSQPIDQTGERIVFTVAPGQVTATIQIAYTGEAKDFAWVIPVLAKPTIDVAPNALFTRLDGLTRPQFWVSWDATAGQCGWWAWDMADSDPVPGATGAGGGVTVVDQQEVGPYKTVTLESKDALALYTWLDDNGFDQPEASIPLIEHYLAQDMLFVAMKLKQDAGVGDIQPVKLTMPTDEPCVPLILTQIAAAPDMPVQIFVLGEERAVPTNWMHVVLNLKKIDWLSGGANYEQVLTAAVDEAAGHAFVTEYAGSSELAAQQLYREGQFDLAALAAVADPVAFVQALLSQGFPRDAQMQSLLRKHIPKPSPALLPEDCREDRDFYATWNLAHCLSYMPDDWTFDPAAFAAELGTAVVEPLKEAQAMVDAFPYLTRLYTTVSPEEMTRDPIFAFNPDLPEVSHLHEAKASATCDADGNLVDVALVLPSGETLTYDGPVSPWGPLPELPEVAGEPSARRIELIGQSGPPQLVDPSLVATLDRRLDDEDPEALVAALAVGSLGPAPVGLPGGASGSASGAGGCGGSGPGGAPLAIGLALLGLALLRRR